MGVIDTWLVSIDILKYTESTLRAHIHKTIAQLDTLLSLLSTLGTTNLTGKQWLVFASFLQFFDGNH